MNIYVHQCKYLLSKFDSESTRQVLQFHAGKKQTYPEHKKKKGWFPQYNTFIQFLHEDMYLDIPIKGTVLLTFEPTKFWSARLIESK